MKWFRVALEVIGAASLLAVVGFGSWNLYSNSSERVNKANSKDALFILNWGSLSTDQDLQNHFELRIVEEFHRGPPRLLLH